MVPNLDLQLISGPQTVCMAISWLFARVTFLPGQCGNDVDHCSLVRQVWEPAAPVCVTYVLVNMPISSELLQLVLQSGKRQESLT